MPDVDPELGKRLTASGLDVPEDMREAILAAADRLAEAVQRLRTSLEASKKAGPSS